MAWLLMDRSLVVHGVSTTLVDRNDVVYDRGPWLLADMADGQVPAQDVAGLTLLLPSTGGVCPPLAGLVWLRPMIGTGLVLGTVRM
jgi:hypothetical protein